jgi:hypothetical protein
VCVAAFLVVAPAGALAISRNNVLVRAQAVVNSPVPYSQSKYVGSWRNDCSGYVSWVWNTGSNLYTTRNLSSISHQIPAAQLQPGDVLLKYDSHVRLFYAWADDAHTKYVSYEQTPPRTWSSIQDLSTDIEAGYKPYRYNKITDSPPPWNVLRNPPFDVWDKGSKSNDEHPELWTPVWWTYGTGGPGTSWQLRKDRFGSSVFALGLTNINPSPDVVVYAQQSVGVEPGKTYNLFTYAGTTTYPSAVRLRLQVYDAANALISDTYTGGDAWGIGAAELKPMSLPTVMPASASRAIVSVSLLGSSNPAGTPGGTAVFDDATFYVTSPMPVYRFFNPKNGTHFYSASGPERDLVANTFASTYTYEGFAYGVASSASNDDSLYRFFNKAQGSYLYTASEAERDDVKARLSSVYTLEGVAYKVSNTAVAGATTVYRFYNKENGTHFYTASEGERDSVRANLSARYAFEGPAFYLAP